MKTIAIALAAMLGLGLATPATAAPGAEKVAACMQSEAQADSVAAPDEFSAHKRKKWKRHGWHGKRKWKRHGWHGRKWKRWHGWYGKRYWRYRYCWRVWFDGRRIIVCR
jgi:hypothetical protein